MEKKYAKLIINGKHFPKNNWTFKFGKTLARYDGTSFIDAFNKNIIQPDLKEFVCCEANIKIQSGPWMGRMVNYTLFPDKGVEDKFQNVLNKIINFKDDTFVLSFEEKNEHNKYSGAKLRYIPNYRDLIFFQQGDDIPSFENEKVKKALEFLPSFKEEKINIKVQEIQQRVSEGYDRANLWEIIESYNKIVNGYITDYFHSSELVQNSQGMFKYQSNNFQQIHEAIENHEAIIESLKEKLAQLQNKVQQKQNDSTINEEEENFDWMGDLI